MCVLLGVRSGLARLIRGERARGAAGDVGELRGTTGGGFHGGRPGRFLRSGHFPSSEHTDPKLSVPPGFIIPNTRRAVGPELGVLGVDEVLARLLQERVVGYLDAVERLAAMDGSRQTAYEARRLVAAWRALLRVHEPTARGGCKACTRARRRMCPVWRVACAYFVHRLPWEPRIRR